jgi:hypothetical protein
VGRKINAPKSPGFLNFLAPKSFLSGLNHGIPRKIFFTPLDLALSASERKIYEWELFWVSAGNFTGQKTVFSPLFPAPF